MRTALLSALFALSLLAGCASSAKGPFQATYDERLTKPEVVIRNDTDLEITVNLTGPSAAKLVVKPRQNDTVTLRAGTYNYVATAQRVAPAKGSTTFQKKHRYTWTFFIKKRPRQR